jgi:hypothetical protein
MKGGALFASSFFVVVVVVVVAWMWIQSCSVFMDAIFRLNDRTRDVTTSHLWL